MVECHATRRGHFVPLHTVPDAPLPHIAFTCPGRGATGATGEQGWGTQLCKGGCRFELITKKSFSAFLFYAVNENLLWWGDSQEDVSSQNFRNTVKTWLSCSVNAGGCSFGSRNHDRCVVVLLWAVLQIRHTAELMAVKWKDVHWPYVQQ